MPIPSISSPSLAANPSVSLVTDVAGARAMAPTWKALARDCDGLAFQGPDWCLAWLEAMEAAGAREDVRILAVHRAERLVALWPLAVRRLGPMRLAHSLGEPLTQYSGILIDRDEPVAQALAAVRQEILTWGDVAALELRRVRADSPLLQLPGLDAGSGSRADGAPFVRIGAPEAQRSGRTRNSLKRRVKQLEKSGPVRFERLQTAEAQVQAVRDALGLKLDWVAERGLASVGLTHPAARACLLNLAERGKLFILRLSVGERLAALEIGLLAAGRYYSFLQSYAPDFARNGPGRLIFWHLVEHGAELGIDILDFLPPAYEHKLEWASATTDVHDYILPVSSSGTLASLYLGRIKPGLKQGFERLPAGVRRQMAKYVAPLA